MKCSVIFNKSGDEMVFEVLHPQVVEYYIAELNKLQQNRFTYYSDRDADQFIEFKFKDLVDNLDESIKTSNDIRKSLRLDAFDLYTEYEYLDQNILNKIHYEWAMTHKDEYIKFDNLADVPENILELYTDDILLGGFRVSDILSKIKKFDTYNEVNLNVHALESIFNSVKFTTQEHISIPNIFDKKIITNDSLNLRIAFEHLGRTQYNKYYNYDDEYQYNDENTFNDLYGFVSICLDRNQNIPFSKQYLDWCKKYNRTPSGDNFNIGYLPDLEENLTKYRQIIYKNIDDSFSLHIGE